MSHLYLQHQIRSCRDKLFWGTEFCAYIIFVDEFRTTRIKAHVLKKFKGRVLLGTTFFWLVGLVGFFRVLLEKTVFGWSVVDQLFQPAQNLVEMVENNG